MNSRTGISSAPTYLLLAFSALFTGCVSEHHWDDEWPQDEIVECPCPPPHNHNNNNNNNNECEELPPPGENCPDAEEAIYLSRDTGVCTAIQFTCPENFESFNDSCGCGCIELPPPPSCPEQQDTTTTYLSQNPAVCAMIDLTCPQGRAAFISDCGCGCIGEATEPPPPVCPDANDPAVTYVNNDPAICASIDFECPQACSRFDSSCGCGCLND
jgi:hypothetical protein